MTIEPHQTPSADQTRRPPDDEISLWEVLAVLVRRRAVIVLTTVSVTVLVVAVTLLGPLMYTTSAAFRPQGTEASVSQLSALASQFGVNVGAGGTEEASPAFYAELLTSREILSRVGSRTFRVAGVGEVLLADLLEIEEDTEELRHEAVIEWLSEDAVSVSTSRETGTVTVSVTTEWPDLSQAIATMLLDEIELFNMDTRQSQAAAERTFIGARVDSARAELHAAETDLQLFLESNRQWQNAPLLALQHDGLQREVALYQSVLTTLVQSYEQARIAEVRDTPVITVLQEPFLPPGRDSRGTVLRAVLGIVLGGMSGIVLAFLIEAWSRPTPGDPGREDFDKSWDGLIRSIPFFGRGRA